MFLFQVIEARKMCFTIFQNEKKSFYAVKTRSLKMCFMIFQHEKKKKRSSKSRKIEIFPKGLDHGFGAKLAIFACFYFRQYRPRKCVSRYSRRKKRLSRLQKQKVKNVENLRFFQRGQSLVYVQNLTISSCGSVRMSRY